MSEFGEKIKHWWHDAGGSASGFSLLEIIIAMVILGVLMLSFALMFSKGKAYIKGQGERRVAINLAQEGLEIINTMAFSTVENNWLGTTTENPPQTFGGVDMDGTGGTPDYTHYTRETFAAYVKDDPLTSAVDLLEDCDIISEACDYIRVWVGITDDRSAAEVGFVEDVSLENVISRWR